MGTTDFRYSLENFRGIAIVFVMLSHLTSLHALGELGRFAHFVVVDATAWFVFISAYLLAHVEFSKKFDFQIFLQKKIKFVFVPYLLLSVPAILAAWYADRPQRYDLNIFEYALWSISVGGNVIGPMWFIPMIFLFFLLSPFFYRLNKRFLPYFVVFALLFSIYSWRPFLDSNPLLAFFHFLGFYLLGLYTHSIRQKIYDLNEKAAIVIVLMGLMLFIGFALVKWDGLDRSAQYVSFVDKIGLFNPMQFGKILLLVSLFIYLEKFLNRSIPVFSKLAQISFGLFFIHGIYMVIYSMFLSSRVSGNLMRLMVELFVVVFLSVLTVNLVKKIFKKWSRYVIGC